jgi:hypothetical protein
MAYSDDHLAERVRQELRAAGFVAELHPPADGGLHIWHDPGRGVVISWVPSTDPAADTVSYQEIHAAVRLALQAVLRQAGYEVSPDNSSGEVVIVSDDLRRSRADGTRRR